MTLQLIDEVVDLGAGLGAVCERLGLSSRTVERWRRRSGGGDLRCGPRTEPKNKLTAQEREKLLAVANSPEFCDLPPSQLVPKLADRGEYLASESTLYRTLKAAQQLRRRGRAAEPSRRSKPPERIAGAANRVWSWDITYLKTPVRGRYFYLYVIMDVWSRKIVAAAVHDREDQQLAADLVEAATQREGAVFTGLCLHADNGGPMKGLTMLAKLQSLGIMPSFSRPSTSNDNPFSESLFRTMKYRPCYPDGSFSSLEVAQRWVVEFVRWYNHDHLHSSIKFTSPADRHEGKDVAVLVQRHEVYQAAKARHPERWTGRMTRSWKRVRRVHLNPSYENLVNLKGGPSA